MNDPTLKRTSVQINYTASDGYQAAIGYNNAPRGKHFVTPTPEAVFLDALEELARLTALFGFANEALTRFTAARERVAAFKTERAIEELKMTAAVEWIDRSTRVPDDQHAVHCWGYRCDTTDAHYLGVSEYSTDEAAFAVERLLPGMPRTHVVTHWAEVVGP